MRIKKGLHINAGISAVVAVFISLLLFLGMSRIDRTFQELDAVNSILSSLYERNALKSDYMMTGSQRARVQWFAENEETDKLLKSALKMFKDAEDKKNLEEMIKNNRAYTILFIDIVENRDKGFGEFSRQVENRLLTQVNIKIYDNVLNIHALLEAARQRLFVELGMTGWGIALFIIVAASMAAISSWTMGRTIARRIERLRRGAAVIGEGNLDYRIGAKGDDEFAELSVAFDAMTEKLDLSYRELENEIEERKKAEKALRRAVDRYQRQVRLFEVITSTTPDFVYLFDLQGRFLYANRRLLEVWGMKLPEIVGKTPRELGYEQWHHDMHLREIGQVIETRLPIKGEVPFKAPLTGYFGVYEYIFAPVIGPDGEVELIAGTTRDVTDRKHAEEERERLIAELEAANKDLEGFTYSVSHDLRAPIRHMSSFAQLLEKEAWPALSEQCRTYLATVLKASRKMGTLVDELLEFSRMGRMEMKEGPVDLNSIVRETLEILNVEIKDRNIQWRISDLPLVRGDAAMLQLVFLNLIGNALKFTRSRSPAVIQLGHKEELTEHVIFVRDNGIGLDMQHGKFILTLKLRKNYGYCQIFSDNRKPCAEKN